MVTSNLVLDDNKDGSWDCQVDGDPVEESLPQEHEVGLHYEVEAVIDHFINAGKDGLNDDHTKDKSLGEEDDENEHLCEHMSPGSQEDEESHHQSG